MPIGNMITTPPEAFGLAWRREKELNTRHGWRCQALIDTEETMSAEDAAALDYLEPGAA